MIHLGDITQISGYTAPIVDCVVGGSPCQDLSVAGKRAGLDGERSGLFMEQIRIIKEMREQDVRNGRTNESIRPRYMVWENVPGAFSSNKGEDFRIVLEETAKIADKDAVIPQPQSGKWQTSGCILGDGWSIAWRVLDAQFWGVPQRRRRIALVADFGGHSAPQILFVPQSVSRNPQPSQPQRKATPADVTRGIGADDIFCIDGDKLNKKERSGGSGMGYREGSQYTLTAKDVHGVAYANAGDNQVPAATGVILDDQGGQQISVRTDGKAPTLRAEAHGNLPCVMEQTVFSKSKRAQTPTDYETWQESDTANTLNTFDQGDVRTNECVIALDRASYNQGKNAQFDFEVNDGGIASTIVAKGPSAVCYSVDQVGGKSACSVTEGQAPTLTCTHGGEPAVCYSHDPLSSNSMKSSNPHSGCHETDVARTIDTTNPDPSKNQGGVAIVEQMNPVVRTRYTVRRLTPLECERLQGYPDGWTDIGEYIDSNGKKKQSSDAARYKALGNSIALPPWKWVMKRLCACYERDATLASLFDGISGFCLIWTQLNGWGSVKWTSEIEEFPIAVCKKHFGDDATGERGDFYEAILGRDTKTDVGER